MHQPTIPHLAAGDPEIAQPAGAEARDQALRGRPTLTFWGGTAIPRTIAFPAFAEIAREIDAILLADTAHIAGALAGGAHPSPVGHDPVSSSSTHKSLRVPRGAM